jgi:CDP-glycerol glycerophosphotransferase
MATAGGNVHVGTNSAGRRVRVVGSVSDRQPEATEVFGRFTWTGLRLALLRLLLWLTPPLRHAVVYGFPDDEGNSVEVARTLCRRLRVYWLVDDDPQALEWLVSGVPDAHRIVPLPRRSVRAHIAYLTARYTFFTHGLYGSPVPPPHKTVVNLWHGDGPKKRMGFARVRSSKVVAGTRLWGDPRAGIHGVAPDDVLVTGNPRIDQFARPADDKALAALGLSTERPVVLWMPTYRKTEFKGRRLGPVRNWSDASELSGSQAVRRDAAVVARIAARVGAVVAVKPHPLDADAYLGLDLPVVTQADLRSARVTLYQVMSRTSGLITDYSSVWTDYLSLDRPLAFYCPDLPEYVANRGLSVDDYPSVLPGPLLETEEDFARFLSACAREPGSGHVQRARSIETIGAETRLGASDRLLDVLRIGEPVGRPWRRVGRRGRHRQA